MDAWECAHVWEGRLERELKDKKERDSFQQSAETYTDRQPVTECKLLQVSIGQKNTHKWKQGKSCEREGERERERRRGREIECLGEAGGRQFEFLEIGRCGMIDKLFDFCFDLFWLRSLGQHTAVNKASSIRRAPFSDRKLAASGYAVCSACTSTVRSQHRCQCVMRKSKRYHNLT